MEFLVIPLYMIAAIGGVVSAIIGGITIAQRADNNTNTDSYIIAYRRTNKIIGALIVFSLMLCAASYVDSSTQPSFRTLYHKCITANGPSRPDDNSNVQWAGTVQRQNSCITVAQRLHTQELANH